MRPAIEVTDADREAAAAFFRDKRTALSVKFTLGHDPSALLEAFARHRLAEREAVVKWLRILGIMRTLCNPSQLADDIEAGEHLK